jgi:hypothetical protein
MTLVEIKNNLTNMFPNNAEQIEEYVIGIRDYDTEEAYDDITLSELEDDFKIFLNFRCFTIQVLSENVCFNYNSTNDVKFVKISELTGVSIPTICSRLNYYGIKKRNAGRSKVRIKCVEDGMVFDSIMQCANHYGLYRENIKKVLCGKYKHTGNKTFITI